MSYVKTVQMARKRAKAFNIIFVVYKVKRRWWYGYKYCCNSMESFNRFQNCGDSNYIKVMMCMPNGKVVQ